MIMEWPGAEHVIGDVEGIDPGLVWTDLVRAAPVRALRPKRPSTVRINPVPEAMHVEAVRQ